MPGANGDELPLRKQVPLNEKGGESPPVPEEDLRVNDQEAEPIVAP